MQRACLSTGSMLSRASSSLLRCCPAALRPCVRTTMPTVSAMPVSRALRTGQGAPLRFGPTAPRPKPTEEKDEWTGDPENIKRGPIGWAALGIFVAAGAAILVYAESVKEEQKKKQKEIKPLQPVGRPALGGPFMLVDPKGNNVKSSDLKGQWLLLYFGFTFCPDICPNELTKLTEAIEILDKQIGPNKVTPVFISIDPERDTPQQVGEYIKDWHPRFVALTGTVKQVSEVCKTFRVYHSKSPTGDGPDEYLVDHSIIIYLIDDDGKFVDFFGKNKTAPEIAEGVKEYIRKRAVLNS